MYIRSLFLWARRCCGGLTVSDRHAHEEVYLLIAYSTSTSSSLCRPNMVGGKTATATKQTLRRKASYMYKYLACEHSIDWQTGGPIGSHAIWWGKTQHRQAEACRRQCCLRPEHVQLNRVHVSYVRTWTNIRWHKTLGGIIYIHKYIYLLRVFFFYSSFIIILRSMFQFENVPYLRLGTCLPSLVGACL